MEKVAKSTVNGNYLVIVSPTGTTFFQGYGARKRANDYVAWLNAK